MLFRNIFLLWLSVTIWVIQPALAGTSNQSDKPPFKVGFIMVGPVADLGWNQAHNEGRLYLEKAMKGKVQTFYMEKVPENAESERIMEKMIAQGAKLIFTTSYGYLEPVLRVAAHHPDVIFMQVNRLYDQSRANIGFYHTYFHEPLYVAGVVAGRITKTNNIGYLLGHPVPFLICSLNAFTIGAHSVNPKVQVHVVCTNSWNDPPAEVEATKGLVERGADVMVSIFDSSLTTCMAAAKAGVYSVGTEYDLNKQVPKSWLTGQCYDFGPFYVRTVQSVMNASWKSGVTVCSLKDGTLKLASFGQSVPPKVRAEALNIEQKIKDGNLTIFRGPLKDCYGKERVAAGKVLDDKGMSSVDWVVPGVECAFAKK